METRINLMESGGGAVSTMFAFSKYLAKSSLEQSLLQLVDLRASQINGCAFCIDMHSKDLRHGGETEQRLYLLDAWRETTFYTERERAALAWTEAITLIAADRVPDDVYEEARKQFNEQEMIDLTMAIVAVNGWNRLNIAFRTLAGGYQAGQFSAATT